MTSSNDVDLELAAYLRARSTRHAPEGLLDATMVRVESGRQRGWLRVVPQVLDSGSVRQLWTVTRTVAIAIVIGLLSALALMLALVVGSPQLIPPTPTLARPGLITFDAAGRIWVAERDGSGRHPITFGPALDSGPVWSHDGTRIAYVSQHGALAPLEVRVIDERGDNGVTVARVLTDPGPIDWSPNDRNLAFSAKLEGSLLPQLVLVSLDRPEAHSIGPADLGARDPIWSPDGRDIAFERANPEDGLWIIGVDGSGLRRLSTVSGSGEAFRRPAWSPDGRRIVFRAGGDGAHRIFTIDRDGRNERPLDSPFLDNGSPAWSPDGSAIAWTGSAGPGNPPHEIVIVDRDGSNARFLETPPLLEPAVLAWSPDARRLLTFLDDQHTSLVVLDATGRDGPIRIPAASSFGGASWQRLTSP